jgi:hypothetical protein
MMQLLLRSVVALFKGHRLLRICILKKHIALCFLGNDHREQGVEVSKQVRDDCDQIALASHHVYSDI